MAEQISPLNLELGLCRSEFVWWRKSIADKMFKFFLRYHFIFNIFSTLIYKAHDLIYFDISAAGAAGIYLPCDVLRHIAIS